MSIKIDLTTPAFCAADGLFNIWAAIIGDGFYFQAELGIGRDFEGIAGLELVPGFAAGELHIQLAAEDFHDFLVGGAEFIIAGQHDAQRFFRAVGEQDGPAGDFAVKIYVCFLYNSDILEFRHGLSFPDWLSPRFSVSDNVNSLIQIRNLKFSKAEHILARRHGDTEKIKMASFKKG